MKLRPARRGTWGRRPLSGPRRGPPGVATRRHDGRDRLLAVAGAVLAVVVAASLFSRFGIDGTLARDEAIYAYGGQQQAQGTPFYVSIVDQKTPLGSMIAAAAVKAGRAAGADDLYAIRLAFFVLACLSVLAVYLLAVSLFQSLLVGLAAAAAFASFREFAFGALTGPQVKQAAVCFAVVSMVLVVRRRYFLGAFAGSLAFLVWQPLIVSAIAALAAAALASTADGRWMRLARTFAGAAIPLVGMALYFWMVDALDDLVASAFVFPVAYLERTDESLLDRAGRIVSVVDTHYDRAEILFWGGLLVLLAMLGMRLAQRRSRLWPRVRDDPYINVLIASLLPIATFTLIDFQGAADLYPLLPYAAIGVGAGVGTAVAATESRGLRRVGPAAGLATVLALVAIAWASYSAGVADERGLLQQRAQAASLERLLDDDDTVYALGNPVPLVLTGRRNPSPYILLIGGFDAWVVDRTPGGFDGWTAAIRAHDPDVIVKSAWRGTDYARRMTAWLRSEYALIRMGRLLVFVDPDIRARAERQGLLREFRPRSEGAASG